MRVGELPRAYSVKLPAVVSLAILLAVFSVSHSSPSSPVVIPHGELLRVGTVNSVMPVLKTTRGSSCSNSRCTRGRRRLLVLAWPGTRRCRICRNQLRKCHVMADHPSASGEDQGRGRARTTERGVSAAAAVRPRAGPGGA